MKIDYIELMYTTRNDTYATGIPEYVRKLSPDSNGYYQWELTEREMKTWEPGPDDSGVEFEKDNPAFKLGFWLSLQMVLLWLLDREAWITIKERLQFVQYVQPKIVVTDPEVAIKAEFEDMEKEYWKGKWKDPEPGTEEGMTVEEARELLNARHKKRAEAIVDQASIEFRSLDYLDPEGNPRKIEYVIRPEDRK
jgi:hypothetical protein